MTTTVLRPVGYTTTYQELTWTGSSTSVTAYLWGGGGGGGGNDRLAGGAGGGGGYAVHTFNVSSGDTIGVAVGGGGGAGYSGSSGGGGGSAGASLASMIFSSRYPPSGQGQPAVYKYSNVSWCGFLNTYGVWEYNVNAGRFERTYIVDFPVTGSYTFTLSCDNHGYAYLDGTEIIDFAGYQSTTSVTVSVTAGEHEIREVGVNTGGPGSYALTITRDAGVGYNGGWGGDSGGGGSSGAGGGGGGATVLKINGTVVAVAGGGGGGGGGGNYGTGQAAPGDRGVTSSFHNGQNGRDKSGDGGGGGGGGGGVNAGQGGQTGSGDVGGDAGVPGTSLGNTTTQGPSGRNPGGLASPYYAGTPGVGGLAKGAGTNGYIAMVFDLPGTFVNVDGTFTPVSKIWVKDNDIWSPVRQTLIKDNGVWKSTIGGMPPIFASQDGDFGTVNRNWTL